MNIRFYGYIIVVALVMLSPVVALSQGVISERAPQIEAKFVPDSIGIGDHFKLEVEVTKDLMQLVAFPEFDDGMIGDILEIMSESEIDTINREGRSMTLRKVYNLTTFEDGYYGLGRFPMLYADKNITDTIWSADSLKIKIGTFVSDTTNYTIYDIKGLKRAPFKLSEIRVYLMWGLVGLLGLAALGWYIFTRRRNMSLLGKAKPIIPPHITAIKELEILHSQKLWQKGDYKLYYTRLTDILRKYLDGRYDIPAMEMTSDEIMTAIKDKDLSPKNFDDLLNILKSADLVKFAKYLPDAEFNENSYTNAYYFVENTKPTEIEELITEQEE